MTLSAGGIRVGPCPRFQVVVVSQSLLGANALKWQRKSQHGTSLAGRPMLAFRFPGGGAPEIRAGTIYRDNPGAVTKSAIISLAFGIGPGLGRAGGLERVGSHRSGCRPPLHLSRGDVELAAVARTGHRGAIKGALAEGATAVRAGVVECEQDAIDIGDGDAVIPGHRTAQLARPDSLPGLFRGRRRRMVGVTNPPPASER